MLRIRCWLYLGLFCHLTGLVNQIHAEVGADVVAKISDALPDKAYVEPKEITACLALLSNGRFSPRIN